MRVSVWCWPGRMVDYLWMGVSVWCIGRSEIDFAVEKES